MGRLGGVIGIAFLTIALGAALWLCNAHFQSVQDVQYIIALNRIEFYI